MRNPIRYLTWISMFAFVAGVFSQDTVSVSLTSRGVGTIPADRIIFNINIETTQADYQKAYDQHKKQMAVLSKIINELQIPDSLVHYSLFNINRMRRRMENQNQFNTRQKITLILKKKNLYFELQKRLIENGFYSFSAKFSSSTPSKGINLAIKNALQSAKNQIQQIRLELKKANYKLIEMKVKQQYQPLPGAIIPFSVDKSRLDIEQIPQQINYVVEIDLKYLLF